VFACSNFDCLDRSLVPEILIIQLRLSSKHLMRLVIHLTNVAMHIFQTTFPCYISCGISSLFQIETPRDVQEKFGRTVVENYLL